MEIHEINPIDDDIEENLIPKKKFCTTSKKLFFVFICSIIIIIIYFLFILSIIKKEENESKEMDNKPDERPDIKPPKSKNETLGYIYCKYFLNNEEEINILNENFEIPINFTVFVDEQKIEYSKNYILKGNGEHNITYVLYDDRWVDIKKG